MPRRLALALSALAALVLAARLGPSRASGPAPGTRSQLVVLPYVPDAVRAPLVVPIQVFLCNAGSAGRSVELEELRVDADGTRLDLETLSESLPAEPAFAAANRSIELLPAEITHLHRPRAFAAPGEPEIDPALWEDTLRTLRSELASLRARWQAGAPPSFLAHDLWLPLDQLFEPGDPPGRVVRLRFEVDWRSEGGTLRTTVAERDLRWLGPPAGLPPELASAGFSLHAGDLHVHSCHGEAANACPPSTDCAAESFQTSGSFSYAQLKTQYQALGYDWFTATDHSYCINSDSEYQAITAEVAAISDASFLALPDIEVSSDEEGPQIGSDIGDTTCLFTTQANHMGAHGISQRIPGGSDGFLGFCNGLFGDALDPFSQTVADVRSQGGYPIVNHPTGAFAWNSFAATQGFEAAQLHGVEIWNGPQVSGQGGDVGRWVSWLLAGRLLYAYGGSDTHDAAFSFGANHALVSGGVLDATSLLAALGAGRVFVSNGPVLTLMVTQGDQSLLMGQVQALPAVPSPDPLTIRADYDFGTGSGSVTLFAGGVGDAGETVLAQSGVLTGAGSFSAPATLRTDTDSWYRAYASGSGNQVAYSNPVFFRIGTGNVASYCNAKPSSPGCLPRIGWQGTPSASFQTPFEVTAHDVVNQKPGLLILGLAAAAIPFQGATLCVAPPTQRGPIRFSGGGPPPDDCSGVFTTDVNALTRQGYSPILVAGATLYAQYWFRDPADPAGFATGLSDALRFTIQP